MKKTKYFSLCLSINSKYLSRPVIYVKSYRMNLESLHSNMLYAFPSVTYVYKHNSLFCYTV